MVHICKRVVKELGCMTVNENVIHKVLGYIKV